MENLQYIIDTVDEFVTYVGEAEAGRTKSENKWRIKKIISDADGLVEVISADGSIYFNKN